MRLNEISRLVPKLLGLKDFGRSYDQLKFGKKKCFLMHFDIRTGLTLTFVNQISLFWYQKFSQRVVNKIKKESLIFVEFEPRYGQNKRGGKFAAPCIFHISLVY